MLVIISPSKTLDFNTKRNILATTNIRFVNETIELVEVLKQKSAAELSQLMGISSKLAQLNAERYYNWSWPFVNTTSAPAIFAFKGEVYSGLDIESMDVNSLDYCSNHLRIISGFYGLLRPLDIIMPYRLEMGTKLNNSYGGNLYSFWGNKITELLNADLMVSKSKYLVNLASMEYYKAINSQKINAEIITPIFKEYKNGEYKVVSIYAKKARGLMARFIMENKIDNPEHLKAFDIEGYYFNNELSKFNEFVFTRK
jgi:uncharacterized protein